jgi:hypothetical protein
MDTDQTTTKAALAEIAGTKLRTLIVSTYRVPQIASGLAEWIDAGVEWPLQNTNLDRPELAGQRPPPCRCGRPLPDIQRSSERERPVSFVEPPFSEVRWRTEPDPLQSIDFAQS